MSDIIGLLFSLPSLLVISAAVAIWIWRSAEQDATREVAGLSPPAGTALSEAGERWLRRQLLRRTRWSIIAIEATICAFAVVVIAAPANSLIDRVLGDARMFLIAPIVGRTIGGTLATVLSVRSDVGSERSAALRPRTVKAYLRPWEGRLRLAHLIAAPTTLIVAACLWASGTLTDTGLFYVGLSLTWLTGVATSELLLWRVLRTPPVVGAAIHYAREYMVSTTVRSLIELQLAIFVLVAYVTTTYATLTDVLPVDLGSMILSLSCSYIMWTVVARTEQHMNGMPGPEWHFARTTGGPV